MQQQSAPIGRGNVLPPLRQSSASTTATDEQQVRPSDQHTVIQVIRASPNSSAIVHASNSQESSSHSFSVAMGPATTGADPYRSRSVSPSPRASIHNGITPARSAQLRGPPALSMPLVSVNDGEEHVDTPVTDKSPRALLPHTASTRKATIMSNDSSVSGDRRSQGKGGSLFTSFLNFSGIRRSRQVSAQSSVAGMYSAQTSGLLRMPKVQQNALMAGGVGGATASQWSLGSVQHVSKLPLWPPIPPSLMRYGVVRMRIHRTMTHPTGSKVSLVFNWIYLAIVVVSLVLMIAESFTVVISNKEYTEILFSLEIITNVFFTVEYVSRLATWPTDELERFFKSIINWTDAIAVVPFWLNLLSSKRDPSLGYYGFWRVVQLFRVFRLFKVIRMSTQLRLAYRAFKKSRDGILMLIFIFSLALTFFSTLVYYAEIQTCEVNANGQLVYNWPDELVGTRCAFQSIVDAMWWCIVTITTTGYGDIVPKSVYGKLVGAGTMLAAVMMFSFPITIFSQSLAEVYREHRQHKATMEAVAQRLKEKREKEIAEIARQRALANGDAAGLKAASQSSLNLNGSVRDLTQSVRAISAAGNSDDGAGVHPDDAAHLHETQIILEQCFDRCTRELENVRNAVEDLTALLSELRTVSSRQVSTAKAHHDHAAGRIRGLQSQVEQLQANAVVNSSGGAGGGGGPRRDREGSVMLSSRAGSVNLMATISASMRRRSSTVSMESNRSGYFAAGHASATGLEGLAVLQPLAGTSPRSQGLQPPTGP
ncbi:hypothetical protein H9P43_005851 [Blastocladiella emersonii ATCC 22665]|nr:hypothetical protein H9P43_005851 [Blastocladiella emersonii ATCC 22665]